MKYVIIGGSAAGISCAETLRKHDKRSSITLISEEKFPLYSRCLLTYLLAGSINEDMLYFKSRDFYERNNINAYLGKKTVSIDRPGKKVGLDDGSYIVYDKLLLATGASAKMVDMPGKDKKGVFTLRNIDDARAIIKSLEKSKKIAVLGGGLIGMRDAYALSKRGKEVTVLVTSPQILSQVLDEKAADIIEGIFKKNGVEILTGKSAAEILGDNNASGILLSDGKKIDCQMIIVGKGVRPNTELAASSGLDINKGIVVDEFLRAADENIFAAGDVAETYDISSGQRRINALWPCAVEQGEKAALNMMDKKISYRGSLSMNSADFFGVACISMGITKPKSGEYETLSKQETDAYKKIVIKDNKIVGAVFTGNVKPAGTVNMLIRSAIDISRVKDRLLDEEFSYATVMPLIKQFEEKFKSREYKDTIITY